ncbi:MAG: hypothetical protein HND56_07140 [Pseudomonadota bacterium]|nr:hypothetical protein [Pseudomonadota bacterium]QKK05471.1 MAG: hypothetical protein HND56_07140 [Pseudomonadota bacterium]
MADDKILTQKFQDTLKNLRSNTETCAVLEKLSAALSDVQQALAQEGVAFGFCFSHYDTISPTLSSGLKQKSDKILERSVTRQCAVTYHIDGQDYSLALARFNDTHYRTHWEFIGSHSFEDRSKERDDNYDAVVSPIENFRFDSENESDPLTDLKSYLVEQAAKQKFLQAYDAKSQPRRIKRTARPS